MPKVYHWHPVGLVGNFVGKKCSCIDIERFVADYRVAHQHEFGWFGSSGEHQNLPAGLDATSEKNLRGLLTEINNQFHEFFGECRVEYIAYMLATVRIESYDFHHGIFFGPTEEGISYEKAERDYGCCPTAINPGRAIQNHNTQIGDGYRYRGRGLVQLTWKIAYENFAVPTRSPLAETPELALQLDIAVKIMLLGMRDGLFRNGHTLARYLGSIFVSGSLNEEGMMLLNEYGSKKDTSDAVFTGSGTPDALNGLWKSSTGKTFPFILLRSGF